MTPALTTRPTTDELVFPAMGGEVRLSSTDRDAHGALAGARTLLCDAAARLSRFEPDSELCALNADPRATVPASALLRAAVRAMQRAEALSGGLVDAALLPALEDAGYRESRAGVRPVPLRRALALAPPRRPARPRPRSPWAAIRVDDRARTISRPPGVRLDTGGIGKGLLADVVARHLWELSDLVVDCAGDIRVAGPATRLRPRAIEIVHPLTQRVAATLWLGDGAIATSGLDRNLWRGPGGGVAHHLLDPSTGEPAWTGLVGATALAASALDAEVLAKTALLSGPEAGRAVLAEHGGVLFHDDGRAEGVGAPAEILR